MIDMNMMGVYHLIYVHNIFGWHVLINQLV